MDFSQPVVSRPRPPRSKSGRLGSSQSSSRGVKGSQTTLDAFCPPEDLAQATTSTSARLNAAHFASISVFETLTPPATPPMANEPSMELLDNVGKVDSAVSHAFGSSKSDRSDPVPQSQIQRESSREHARSPEELEQMLAEARRIIEERETELGIAASIGKSLLDNNIALRAKQDALLQRVQLHTPLSPHRHPTSRASPGSSPTSIKGKERASQSITVPFPSLLIPKAFGAHGEYVEGLPPPSPRQSYGRSSLRNSVDLKGNIATLFAHTRTASNDSSSSVRSSQSITSPRRTAARNRTESTSHPFSGHHRRQSSTTSALGSAISVGGDISRSSSTKSIAELQNANLAQQRQLQLEIQRLRLSEQNAELENRLEELECEVNKADVVGKNKLRRLDKELMGLKKELESALDRNKELEEKLALRQNAKVTISNASGLVERTAKESEAELGTETSRTRTPTNPTSFSCMPTDTDPETSSAEPLVETSEGTHEAILHKSDQSPFPKDNASPSVGVHSDIQTTGDIVSQLLAKVNELQEANSHISAHKDALNDRLAAASSQFDEMRRKYEFLEERVIEAEIRNHRILELEDGEPITEDALMAIEWRQDDNGALMLEHDSVSPATKIKRKAVGNRPRIEQYRRLSSLYGSQAGNDLLLDPSSAHDSPPRKGTYGPSNSRTTTPLRDSSSHVQGIPHYSAKSSRLFVSPARSTTPSESKGRPRAGTFFETESAEDIITTMQRRLQDERDAFEKRHSSVLHDRANDDLLDEARNPSQPHDRTSGVSRHHSLASEMGKQWREPPTHLLTDEGSMHLSCLVPSGINAEDIPCDSDTPEDRQWSARIVPSASTLSLVKLPSSGKLQSDEEEEEYLGNLLPSGPADAQSYDDMQAALQDLSVQWEDDVVSASQNGQKRIAAPFVPQTRRASLPWTYEDGDSENSDNDPWKEEESTPHHALESAEQVQLRERVEARSVRRRKRLQQLARQMLEDENEETEANHTTIEEKLALVRVDSNESATSRCSSLRSRRRPSNESLDYEEVQTAISPRAKGTDYWPVAYKARYSPAIVAMRVQKTSQEYLNMCMLWTKFLVVLAVAVVFSIWRGPEAGLGVRRRSRKRLHASGAVDGGTVAVRGKPKREVQME